jgi:outer membrane lipoprotein-sorting protein
MMVGLQRFIRCGRVCMGLVATAVMLVGCATAPTFKPSGVASAGIEACQQVVAGRTELSSLRALIEATLHPSRTESVSFRYGVVSKQPGLLRIDVLPLEGAYTLGMIVVRPEGATVIDTQEQKYSEATEADDLLQRFLGLRGLTPSVIQALVTRQVPKLRCEEVAVYRAANTTYTFVDTRHHVAWEIDATSRLIEAVQLLDVDNERVEARAEIAVTAQQNPEIRFSVYVPISTSAEMVVRKLSLNPPVSDQLFNVQVPRGYQRDD